MSDSDSVHPAERSIADVRSESAGSVAPNLSNLFMVFDVESIGLHGDGFAVAYVVVRRDGERLEEGCFSCDPSRASGTDESRLWVSENLPPLDGRLDSPRKVREAFWRRWLHWKEQGAVLVADCAWPVEARFLAAAVDDHHQGREWEGPYPLHDLASVLMALGRDPLATNARLCDELPAHHPLMDSRQSARLLVSALATAQAAPTPQPAPSVTKWTLTTDPLTIRRMGKTGEECAELLAVTTRIVIQGIDEIDPGTGKTNRQRLIEEIGDVYAQLDANTQMLGLDEAFIQARRVRKLGYMREWEALYEPASGRMPLVEAAGTDATVKNSLTVQPPAQPQEPADPFEKGIIDNRWYITKPVWVVQEEPQEQADDGCCTRCGQHTSIPPGYEPTAYCNDCAQEIAAGVVQEAAQPVRAPFTKAQVHRLYTNTPGVSRDAESLAAFERVVRLVEAAHRVTQPPKEQP